MCFIAFFPADFNPRSPRGGATVQQRISNGRKCLFQSTLPTRGSDAKNNLFTPITSINFNPRSPRGGATVENDESDEVAEFQSTLPTRGSDATSISLFSLSLFQSTLPTRGSDAFAFWHFVFFNISIHAPHEGERRC